MTGINGSIFAFILFISGRPGVVNFVAFCATIPISKGLYLAPPFPDAPVITDGPFRSVPIL